MKSPLPRNAFALSLLATILLAGFALAQDDQVSVPRFVTLPPHPQTMSSKPAAQLAQWNGSFTDRHGVVRNFTMAGGDPATSNEHTVIPVVLIPIKMVYGKDNGDMTFNPNAPVVPNGDTVTKNVLASPVFTKGIKFVQGGTNLGFAQYVDAYQRANFWSDVKQNRDYHVILGKPTKLPLQTIHVTPAQGHVASEFGKIVGLMDINAFDSQLQTFMNKFSDQITPDVLPLFLTYDIYLTSGGCCIGGYHSANGVQPAGQTYAYSTWVDQGNGVFSQDVAALTHEIGEWMDDPFVDNRVGCQDNGILENGDPLVLHDFPYDLHGFTYHLQDLVFLAYFGAPRQSLHHWLSFQNDETHVCPGQ
jgi:hypothetical protein